MHLFAHSFQLSYIWSSEFINIGIINCICDKLIINYSLQLLLSFLNSSFSFSIYYQLNFPVHHLLIVWRGLMRESMFSTILWRAIKVWQKWPNKVLGALPKTRRRERFWIIENNSKCLVSILLEKNNSYTCDVCWFRRSYKLVNGFHHSLCSCIRWVTMCSSSNGRESNGVAF